MALTIPNDTLAQAAIAVHDVLIRNSLTHVFLGGYELVLLGSTRGTKDIDVEVAKPFFRGFEKVKEAFTSDPNFIVFDGTTEEGIRAIWNKTVGVDILMRQGNHLPKSSISLPVGPPSDPATEYVQRSLAFLTPTHLLIEKIRSAGTRQKTVDAIDVCFIYDTLALRDGRVDLNKVKKRLSQQDVANARQNHEELLGRVLDAIAAA